MAGEPSFDLDAAALRADAAGLGTDVEVLAAKLEGALPGACTVERRARGLFDREKVVEAIEVRLGPWRYTVRAGRRGRVEAAREQEVRGVVIKRQPMELGAWVDGLAGELAQQARTSAEARTALQRLIG